MNYSHRLAARATLLLASMALLGLTGAAQAQPGDNGPVGNGMPGGMPGGRGNRQGGQQGRVQMREQQLRQMLTGAGYADKALQDAVIAFAAKQDPSKQALRQNMTQLRQVIADTTTTTSSPARRVATIRSATRLTRSASATEEPPYFCTTSPTDPPTWLPDAT